MIGAGDGVLGQFHPGGAEVHVYIVGVLTSHDLKLIFIN